MGNSNNRGPQVRRPATPFPNQRESRLLWVLMNFSEATVHGLIWKAGLSDASGLHALDTLERHKWIVREGSGLTAGVRITELGRRVA